jgi:DNA-directed RNA polymerase subunit RPC12/RpoP
MKSFRLYPALYAFLIVLVIASILLAALHHLWWPFSLLLYFAVIGFSLTLLIRSHSGHTLYTCRACDTRFGISPWQDFVSPQTLTQKYLKCPHCRARSWATIHERVREGAPL